MLKVTQEIHLTDCTGRRLGLLYLVGDGHIHRERINDVEHWYIAEYTDRPEHQRLVGSMSRALWWLWEAGLIEDVPGYVSPVYRQLQPGVTSRVHIRLTQRGREILLSQ